MISSRQNGRIVYLSSLSECKTRKTEGKFLIEGKKLVYEAMKAGIELTDVLCTENFAENNTEFLSGITYETITEPVLEKLSSQKAPDGIIACGKIPSVLHRVNVGTEFGFSDDEKIFAVSHIQDAGNLGTMIRTANAFGIDHLIMDDQCADLYNAKTVRAAMGGLFRMKITICRDFCAAINALKKSGRNVYAAALDRDALRADETEIIPGDVFVVGNEGHGLDKEVIDICTRSIFIPMNVNAESLNASQAATILMWEMYRNR